MSIYDTAILVIMLLQLAVDIISIIIDVINTKK